jgi:hypothetical protein
MGFFSKLLNQSQPAACVLSETHAVVRQIVGVLGYDVVATSDYGARLAPALNFAVEYYDKQIAQIPGSAGHIGRALHAPPPGPCLVPGAPGDFPWHRAQRRRQAAACHSLPAPTSRKSLPCLASGDRKRRAALREIRCSAIIRCAALPPPNPGPARVCARRHWGALVSSLRRASRQAAQARKTATRAEWNIENRDRSKPSTETDRDAMVLASGRIAGRTNMLRGMVAWLQRPR